MLFYAKEPFFEAVHEAIDKKFSENQDMQNEYKSLFTSLVASGLNSMREEAEAKFENLTGRSDKGECNCPACQIKRKVQIMMESDASPEDIKKMLEDSGSGMVLSKEEFDEKMKDPEFCKAVEEAKVMNVDMETNVNKSSEGDEMTMSQAIMSVIKGGTKGSC
jgi:hypothetical protein